MARANIRQIEAFNAVMKSGSVTLAAKSLFISQPAVTKLIKSFEDSCGFPLFVRASSRLQPMPEAHRLYLETDKLITGVARVENVARAIRDLERGEVSIVAFPSLCLRFLPRVMSTFSKERPDVHISIETRTSRQIFESMLTGTADAGLSLVSTSHSGLECKLFHESDMVCALPPDHLLCEKSVVDLRDLAREPFISLGRGDLSHQLINEAFDQVGISIEPLIRAQMADSACTFVSEGRGVSLVSVQSTLAWRDDQVVFRPVFPAPKTSMWLYSRTNEPLSMMVASLLAMVREELDALNRKNQADPNEIAKLPPLPIA